MRHTHQDTAEQAQPTFADELGGIRISESVQHIAEPAIEQHATVSARINVPRSKQETTAMEAATQAVASGKIIKISANLPAATVNDLRLLAAARGITITEALRRSIGTAKFIMDAGLRGGKVLIEDSSGRLQQIVLL